MHCFSVHIYLSYSLPQELISDLRDVLKTVREEVDALKTELSVTKTANRVGCSKEELVGAKVDCSKDQLGKVIGKKGKTVKQIMKKDSVTVNVLKEGDIRIMGTADAIDSATADIDKVLSTTEKNLDVSPELVAYLTAKDVTAVDDLRARHPDVHIFVQKKSATIPIRGTPSDIENVVVDLQGLGIKVKEFELGTAEAAHVIGKQGATVEALQAKHQVAIDVHRNKGEGAATSSSRVTVVGPVSNVDVAITEIRQLADDFREDTQSFSVDPSAKAVLLADSGAGIKKINKEVNKKLEGGHVNMSFKGNEVVVKGQVRHLSLALQLAEEAVKSVEDMVVRIDTDPAVLPVIIGKGGETIKKLREGKSVNIETDKSGTVTLCGLDKDEVSEVEQAVKDIIATHHVKRINIDASLYKSQSRNLIRNKSKEIGALCFLTCDDDRCDIVLRGEEEKVASAEAIGKEFLESNFREEVTVTGEDMGSLLRGGKDCKMEELAAEFDVKLHSDRERGVVAATGKRDNVQKAISALHRFLFGGDGFSVAKIRLSNELLGAVIGKGGKNMTELREKFESLSIAVDGRNCIINIRGPEEDVEKCRIHIAKFVAAAKVSATIRLTPMSHEQIGKANAARAIVHGIPVQVNISKDSVTVRGYAADVEAAEALLNATIQGRYDSRIALPAPLFDKVKDTCSRNSVHLDRIMKASGASLVLDSSDGAIVLRGKREQVKLGKIELMKFLDFVLQSCFGTVDVPIILIPVVADVPTLAEVSAITGASLLLDRDVHQVLIFSTDSSQAVEASAVVASKISKAKDRCFDLQLDPTEDWVVSALIGKRGARISELRKSTNCHIDVDSKSHKISMSSDDPDTLVKGREAVEEIVEKARRECTVVKLQERDLPAFIGRGGAGITEFSKTHSVEVQVMKNYPGSIRLAGKEENVAAASASLYEWLKDREETKKQSHGFEVVQVRKNQIRTLLASKGAIINSVQSEFRCRIDIDRESAMVSIRASNQEKRKAAAEKIIALLSEENQPVTGEEAGSGESGDEQPRVRAHGSRRRGRKKESGDEGDAAAAPAKKSQQKVPNRESDFPALSSSGEESVGGSLLLPPSSPRNVNGNWVTVAGSQERSDTRSEEEEAYLSMVADGAPPSADSSIESVTAS